MSHRIDHISPFSTTLRDDGGKKIGMLLWGDPVRLLGERQNGRARVFARGKVGWVDEDALGGESLLEIYVVDVGQGDGVLFKTPDGKYHLIDGGTACRRQMTGKSVANFVRWKAQRELGLGAEAPVRLQSMFMSHPDDDHFAGLVDVLAGAPNIHGEREFDVHVENLYHNGMARFDAKPNLGATVHGEIEGFPCGAHGLPEEAEFITELLADKASFAAPPRPLKGGAEPRWTDFANFAALVGEVPANVHRISQRTEWLPGYEEHRKMRIRVLGPIVESLKDGGEGLRMLPGGGKDNESVTRNGHSLVLRLDYKNARILMTGDINDASQRLLLSYLPAEELAADVVKLFHHGSPDLHTGFLEAVGARATIISSGDNESYSHPRPMTIGAAAWYGRESVDPKGRVQPPLVYCTELARSVALAMPERARVFKEKQALAEIEVAAAASDFRPLDRVPVSTNLVYGLVNVRTDGRTILCATLRESGDDFEINTFVAGADASADAS